MPLLFEKKVRLMSSALFFFLFFFLNIFAADFSVTFDQANRAYTEGKYEEAAALYEKIIADRGYSAPVLFNLGNTYEHLNHPGLAILNYKRAQRLSPRDPEIQANLRRAQTEAGVPLPVERWWRTLLTQIKPEEWAFAASLGFSLFALSLLVRWFWPYSIQKIGISRNFSVRAWRLIVTALGVATFLATACLALSMQHRVEAVVIEKQASLYVSPYEKATVLESLPEGETVNAEKKHDHFIYVRHAKGQGGWVDEKQIALVEPGAG